MHFHTIHCHNIKVHACKMLVLLFFYLFIVLNMDQILLLLYDCRHFLFCIFCTGNVTNNDNVTSRQERLDFPSFVRILAHFRPIDKNQSKEPSSPDPVNSRLNKLKCTFMTHPGKGME